jgi:pyruvate ferredoxin oxidoreductase gamma subunit
MTEVRWHGRGGQGCFTAARLLGLAAVLEGRYALAFPAFGPERRGAPVAGYSRLDDHPVRNRSAIHFPDAVVVLDATLLGPAVFSGVRDSTLVLVNAPEGAELKAPEGSRVYRFDATALAREWLGKPIVNTAMLGALAAITGWIRLEYAEEAVASELRPQHREKNTGLLREAFKRFSHVA